MGKKGIKNGKWTEEKPSFSIENEANKGVGQTFKDSKIAIQFAEEDSVERLPLNERLSHNGSVPENGKLRIENGQGFFDRAKTGYKELSVAMRSDPVSRLRELAVERRNLCVKIADLHAALKRFEADVYTVMCNTNGFEAEVLRFLNDADDREGRIIRGFATLEVVRAIELKMGI